jgi:hypothetical protein
MGCESATDVITTCSSRRSNDTPETHRATAALILKSIVSKTLNLYQAKTQLSRLVEEAAGLTVVTHDQLFSSYEIPLISA